MTNDKNGLSREISISLDWIRGVSAQLVLFGHAISFLGVLNFLEPPSIPYMQNVGVILFFFISGVVIAFTIDRRDQTFSNFTLDRATRIGTVLIPALIFVAIVDSFFMWSPRYAWLADSRNVQTFVGNALLLADYPNFKHVPRFGTLAPIWTVILEFWLYVFFGFIALFTTIKSRLVLVLSVAIFVYSTFPVFRGFTNGTGEGICFAWVFGALYYQLVLRPNRTPFPRQSLYLSLACLAGFLIGFKSQMATYGYDARYSLAICLTVACSLELVRQTRFSEQYLQTSKRWSHWLAKFSFSLYLVHYTILSTIPIIADIYPHPLSEFAKIALLAVYLVVCNVVAYIFYLLFEQHYHEVRNWLRTKIRRFRSGSLQES